MTNKDRQKDHPQLHLARLFPNIVTIIGLCLGLSAIRFALKEQFEMAVTFVILAACIDGLDGRLARILNATSTFGAQLDSLADFLNFGVAPPFILYMWATHEIRGLGWALVLFFAVCCAIRLARFNTDLEAEDDENSEPWPDKFFKGIPSPAGAIAALYPMIAVFAFEKEFPSLFVYLSFFANPLFICLYVILIALLMASSLPTISFKKISIPRKYASLVLVIAGLIAIALLTEPWLTIFGVGIWYFTTLPISFINYMKLTR